MDRVAALLALVTAFTGFPGGQDSTIPTWAVQDQKVGEGDVVLMGDRVTIHFQVIRGDGKALADTGKRGLPFTFVVGDPAVDQLLTRVVQGMRPGGQREALGKLDGEERRAVVRLVKMTPAAP